ncbi:hypothetical protein [Nocardia stercoris]|uniref:Uncharacterized protein n=1 Tax=Nocardia stercoris TaxID=2483361 RepID=A0A3M2LAY5_9NOCA|nr:hypothetical protein [Nocardia stercoris]RMI31778.1 hypothetical protein EBN03_16435 [Nocardia stercoris]
MELDALRRFAATVRRAGRELEPVAALDVVVRISELVPQSAALPAWCESACCTAELVQRLAGCFELLALRVDRAIAESAAADGVFATAATGVLA